MLVSDNEYGAPWNDQFYIVTVRNENVEWEETLVLSGPKNYDNYDILEAAKGMFPHFEIVNIKPYEICR